MNKRKWKSLDEFLDKYGEDVKRLHFSGVTKKELSKKYAISYNSMSVVLGALGFTYPSSMEKGVKALLARKHKDALMPVKKRMAIAIKRLNVDLPTLELYRIYNAIYNVVSSDVKN